MIRNGKCFYLLRLILLLLSTTAAKSAEDHSTGEPLRHVCNVCNCDGDYSSSSSSASDINYIECISDDLNVSNPFEGFSTMESVTSLTIRCPQSVDLVLPPGRMGEVFPTIRYIGINGCSLPNADNNATLVGLRNLYCVKLTGNNLTAIPSALLAPVAKSLWELRISYQNWWDEIPANVFSPFMNMEKLTLEENQIKRINSNSFAGLLALTELSLSANKITTIPLNTFTPFNELRILNLQGNELEHIPDDVTELTALRTLDLSGNKLRSPINLAFLKRMPHLSRLSLEKNTIHVINDSDVTLLSQESPYEIYLCDNPFTCTSEICTLLEWYFFAKHKNLVSYTTENGKRCSYFCTWPHDVSLPLTYFDEIDSEVYSRLCPENGLYLNTTIDGGSVPSGVDKKTIMIYGVVVAGMVLFAVVISSLSYVAFHRWKRTNFNHIFAGMRLFWKKRTGTTLLRETISVESSQSAQQPFQYTFDALVYHHHEDTHFVDERLRPRLEEQPNDFRLCLPLLREIRLGAKKLNNLRESIVFSRCAVFVISQAFVWDSRCKQALEVCCDFLHRDDLGPPHLKQTGLILIVLDPVLLEQLPDTLRVLVDRLVTLEWDWRNEERCWQCLEQNLARLRLLNEI